MTETMRTWIYVGAAAFSLLVAGVTSRPVGTSPAEFKEVGQSFFPDFTDASAAKSLQVVSYNPDTAEAKIFGVEQGKDGVWRIPSRNNYPVDGKDRLAKTATSVIDIKREALVSPRESEHAEFGVIDPLKEGGSNFKGIGNRVTLKDGKDGKVLADLIIGKEVKGRPGYFYVRNPNEKSTYTAKVSIDVSTKLADWIEPDLLKVDGSKLRSIIIDKHTIELAGGRGRVTGQETNKLTRANATDKWALDGLDTEKEEVNEDEVRKLVQSLDDLKIVGVRAKSDRLKKRLEDDKGIVPDERTQIEMQDMGFFFVPTQGRRAMAMVSQEGDVFAGTDQGVVYELHFGSVFTGSAEEVEAGFINPSDDKAEGDKKPEEKKADEPADEKQNSKKVKSRYLFVQAQFDPELLGTKPEEPVKPEAPPEAAKPTEEKADAPADANAAENDPAKADAQKAYEATLKLYEADMAKYQADVKAYDEKVEAGKKLVKDLNRRFAEWYYAISGDSFEDLRQGRKTLVKAKAAPENPAAQQPPAVQPAVQPNPQ